MREDQVQAIKRLDSEQADIEDAKVDPSASFGTRTQAKAKSS
jgi:hypothetical protein